MVVVRGDLLIKTHKNYFVEIVIKTKEPSFTP
jgi:hypothetical protein